MIRKTLTILPILFILALTCATHGIGQDSDQPKIIYIEGVVSINFEGERWEPAKVGMGLDPKTEIKTGSLSYCDITFDQANKNIVSLGPNAQTQISEYFQKIDIKKGRVFTRLKGLETGSEFIVEAPQFIVGARGTEFETVVEDETGQVNVNEDIVTIKGKDDQGQVISETNVPEGQSIGVSQDGWLSELSEISGETKDRMDSWTQRIEKAIGALARSKSCSDLISGYQGASASLFADVIRCDAGVDQEVFAASGTNDLVLQDRSGDSSSITGGDITLNTFFQEITPPPIILIEPPNPVPVPDFSCCPATNPQCAC